MLETCHKKAPIWYTLLISIPDLVIFAVILGSCPVPVGEIAIKPHDD